MVLAIMITEQCNFHCRHCMVDSSPQFSRISDEVLNHFYRMAELAKPDDIYLLGGEPLLHIDTVENIVLHVRPYCKNITVFTNGTFLLDPKLTARVDAMHVTIRIGDDRFHRETWTPKLRELITSSRHWVARVDDSEDMIPVGRAYEEFKHLEYNLGCSMLTGKYDESYPNHHRYMVMLNGDVNLYCATIEAALANVFEDSDITYDLLVEREKALHNYLLTHVIRRVEDTYMARLCNECPRYKVTGKHIFYDGKAVASVKDYTGYYIDCYERLRHED